MKNNNNINNNIIINNKAGTIFTDNTGYNKNDYLKQLTVMIETTYQTIRLLAIIVIVLLLSQAIVLNQFLTHESIVTRKTNNAQNYHKTINNSFAIN